MPERFAGGRAERREASPGLPVRLGIERIERGAASRRQRDRSLARIAAAAARDQPALLEPPQQAARIAGVEIELSLQRGGEHGLARRDLVKQPRLDEAQLGSHVARREHARETRVDAVERAKADNDLVDGGIIHAKAIGEKVDDVK